MELLLGFASLVLFALLFSGLFVRTRARLRQSQAPTGVRANPDRDTAIRILWFIAMAVLVFGSFAFWIVPGGDEFWGATWAPILVITLIAWSGVEAYHAVRSRRRPTT